MRPRLSSVVPAGLAGAFFLSGAAALVYELLWFRLLSHVLGSTATATATLLASYLFGLGLGAWIFGRLADRAPSRASLFYAAAEAGIGLYGLASHGLFAAGASLYALTHAWAADSPGRLFAGRFVVSFVLVVLPTVLMGGTFPLMVRLLRDRGAETGRAAGIAYAVNTAGAAVGTLLLPFVLLPKLGVAGSLAAAAGANIAAMLLVLASARAPGRAEAPSESRDAERAATGPRRSPGAGPAGVDAAGWRRDAALALSFFFSSFAALALETVWTRHLGIFFGTKIHTFAFVLFAYLVGLFLGGSLYARLSASGRSPATLLHGGLLLAALSAAIPIPLLDRLSIPQVELMIRAGVSYGSFLATTGLVTLALVLIPAAGFGVVFPAVVDLFSRGGRSTGRSVGAAYVVNTLGTSLGAPAAGFLLIPKLGSQRTLELCVLLVAAALALAPGRARAAGAGKRPPLWRYATAAALTVVFLLPRWDWRLAHAQYVKDPPGFAESYANGTLWPRVVSYDIESMKEGAEATVSVCKFGDGSRSLYVNGKADASNILVDMVVQRLLGVIPALFHPKPMRALVVGVGSGTTVAMLHRFGIPRIDAAEISPEVVEAAREYFLPINEGVLDAREVALHVDDGRSFLHFQPRESYDIVVSEPSNPWMSGVSALFTDEFFAEIEERLRPGGVACQWFHLYTMSPEHVRLIVRTFRRHFPQSAIFLTRSRHFDGDMILIGCKGPLRLARLPEDPSVPARIKLALSEVLNAGNGGFLGGFAGGPEETASYAGEGRLNTDDRPILELEAPADLFDREIEKTFMSLIGSRPDLFLPAGPTEEESSTAIEIARDGLAPRDPIPPGREIRRGVRVLTKLPASVIPLRWVLLGRDLTDPASDGEVSTRAGANFEGETGLYWLARPLLVDDEMNEIAKTLAGPGASAGSTGADAEIQVNGHDTVTAVATEGGRRTVVVGWACPVRRRAFFLRRIVGESDGRSVASIVRALLDEYPCDHAPGR